MNTINWLIQSGLGVINAATIKIITTAYLRVDLKKLGVMMPIWVNIYANTGNSKANPQPKIILAGFFIKQRTIQKQLNILQNPLMPITFHKIGET